jgi:hypothetical protein
MSKKALVLACSVAATAFTFEAQALPGVPGHFPAATPDITPVRGFCGLGFHRGPYGNCVRNGVPYGYAGSVVVAPPVVVAPRVVCPYPYHYSPSYGGCLR